MNGRKSYEYLAFKIIYVAKALKLSTFNITMNDQIQLAWEAAAANSHVISNSSNYSQHLKHV